MNESDPRDPRLDAAYRDAAGDEPSAALDERIRAAAHRAVTAGPQSLDARARAEAQRSWIARWRVPLSIAATVVVAVTLSYMVEREEAQLARVDGLPGDAPPVSAAAAPTEAQRPPAPDAARATRSAEVESRPVEATPAASAFQERQITERPPSAPAPATTATAPAKTDASAANGMLAKEAERRQAASEAASGSAPPARFAPQAMQPAPVPAAPPPPAPAPMAKPAPAPDLADLASRDRALAERPGRMERGAVSVAAEQKVRTPEEWLEDLRRLKAAGRTDEFVKELAEFRKRYPDYKFPADILP